MEGERHVESTKSKLVETRKQIERRWRATAEILVAQGQPELTAKVRRFAAQMRPPRKENEQLAYELLERLHERRTPDASRVTRSGARLPTR